MLFLRRRVKPEKVLKEIEYLLKNSNTTFGYMKNGSCIETDFGYVELFFDQLMKKGDFK